MRDSSMCFLIASAASVIFLPAPTSCACAKLGPERVLSGCDECEELRGLERPVPVERLRLDLAPAARGHEVVLDRVLERSLGVLGRHLISPLPSRT